MKAIRLLTLLFRSSTDFPPPQTKFRVTRIGGVIKRRVTKINGVIYSRVTRVQ